MSYLLPEFLVLSSANRPEPSVYAALRTSVVGGEGEASTLQIRVRSAPRGL